MSKIIIPDLKLNSIHRTEVDIKRSRFIVSLAHTPTQEAAKDFIKNIHTEFADATHNCWAYIVNSSKIGYSDDGEPHGTAGKPMLAMLSYSGVIELSTVVTRYFGGTKLGTGGLVRAYQGMVKLGLETLPCQEKIELTTINLTISYSHVDLFMRLIPELSITIENQNFTADANYKLSLPQINLAHFKQAITDLTANQLLLEEVKT